LPWVVGVADAETAACWIAVLHKFLFDKELWAKPATSLNKLASAIHAVVRVSQLVSCNRQVTW